MAKARFHTWLVKMRNTAAISSPMRPPPSTPMKSAIAAGKKPSTGTDWPTSRSGSRMRAAPGRVAAVTPAHQAKASESA